MTPNSVWRWSCGRCGRVDLPGAGRRHRIDCRVCPEDVRVPSAQALADALARCPLVAGAGTGPLRPLVLADSDDGPLLYLHKYFRQEHVIRSVLDDRAARAPRSTRMRCGRPCIALSANLAPRMRMVPQMMSRRSTHGNDWPVSSRRAAGSPSWPVVGNQQNLHRRKGFSRPSNISPSIVCG